MKEMFKTQAPELINNLFEVISDSLRKNGIAEEEATSIAIDATNEVIHNWRGQQIYIPQALQMQLSQRDLHIYHSFNGYNHSELAKKHGISVQRIYKIIEKVRKNEMARRQLLIFTDDDFITK